MEKEGVSEGGEEGHFYKCQKRSEVKKRAMPQNFLDLHIVKTVFPLPQSELILSGGEPLLHPALMSM